MDEWGAGLGRARPDVGGAEQVVGVVAGCGPWGEVEAKGGGVAVGDEFPELLPVVGVAVPQDDGVKVVESLEAEAAFAAYEAARMENAG
ncbi:hypothetical protein GCM10010440_59270 [Kitasatospora cinereorecta]